MENIRIGEVAAQAGVSVQTLRYYERRGLIKSAGRRASGYRLFSPDAVRLIKLIKWAQSLGFTLIEIGDMLELATAKTLRPSPGVRTRATAKIKEIDAQIAELRARREVLAAIADCLCDGNCPIISSGINQPSHRKTHREIKR